MRFLATFAILFVAATALISTADCAVAQNAKKNKKGVGGGPGGPGLPVPKGAERTRGEGTIREIGPNGLIHVIGAGGAEWFVQVSPRSKSLVYTGSAELSWLQPGHYVRFSTKLDKKGKSVTPVSSLLVLTQREEFAPGIMAENVGGGGFDTTGLFVGGEEQPKKAPKKKK